ncbi:MAG: hypothetical protein U0790_01675 [Isosphaeraceae bacterium]
MCCREDAAKFEQRRAAWTRELSPGGEVGDYLAERAVKLSWQLDRADAAEHAELTRRVRDLPKERGGAGAAAPPSAPQGAGRRPGSRAGRQAAARSRRLAGPAGVHRARLPGGCWRPGKVFREADRGEEPARRLAWDVELPMVRLLSAADRPAAARSRCEACPHRRGAQFGAGAVDGGGGPPDGAG